MNILCIFSDSGLVVPSITQDLRSRLIESAEQFGFTTERLVEQFGRSAAEMTMQLLGGNCRWFIRVCVHDISDNTICV